MEEEIEIKPEITNKLALALDVDDLVVAVRLARDLNLLWRSKGRS